MKVFLVGGAVRDKLLGLTPQDLDFVVVGADENELLEMGLRKVGKDFPTFINQEGSQFSLARRSRKNGNAYFGREVTLVEDLLKRDLTINAMAHGDVMAPAGDQFIHDPFNGRQDLQDRVLRMTRPSSFREDPIRVLRVARFAARYPDFTIEHDTMSVMKKMVAEGMLDDLVPERVWSEISRGLMESKPSRMLQVMHQCGALQVVLPEVAALYGVPQPVQHHPEVDTGIHIEQVMDYAASQNFVLAVRVAALLHDLGKALTPRETWPAHHGHEGLGVQAATSVCRRLKVPNDITQVVLHTTAYHGLIHSSANLKSTSVVKLLRHCDAFRNPDRFQLVLQACLCDARGRRGPTGNYENVEYPQPMRLMGALWAARKVKGDDFAFRFRDRPQEIAMRMHAERARAIKAFDKEHNYV